MALQDFFQQYFVDPIIFNTGYNPVNTVVYGIILIVAFVLTYKMLKKLKINIDKRFFFGVIYMQDGIFFLPYSDIEKTFIDMVVYKQPISLEVLVAFKKRINEKKLNRYLKNYSKKMKNEILAVYSK